MKQLAIIASIFMPLTFITGFFGQNFSCLVQDVIGGKSAFFVFGIGLDLLAMAFLILFFRRRGLLQLPAGGPGQASVATSPDYYGILSPEISALILLICVLSSSISFCWALIFSFCLAISAR